MARLNIRVKAGVSKNGLAKSQRLGQYDVRSMAVGPPSLPPVAETYDTETYIAPSNHP